MGVRRCVRVGVRKGVRGILKRYDRGFRKAL